MKRRKRIYYTDTQKVMMWDRWQQGESLRRIAPLFDRHYSSVRNILAEHGGIRPPVRRRSPRVLSLAERDEISRRQPPEDFLALSQATSPAFSTGGGRRATTNSRLSLFRNDNLLRLSDLRTTRKGLRVRRMRLVDFNWH